MTDRAIKSCRTCGRIYRTDEDLLRHTSRWRICESGHLWFNCSCHSTNMVPKGKFSWYSPDQHMSPEARSLFNRLPALRQLPHIPTAVMELQQLIHDENATTRQMALVAKRMPFVAGNIMKIANAMKLNPGTKISSLEHAISYIGIKAIDDILTTASVSSFPFRTKSFNQETFWQEAFLTGRIAEALCQRFAPSSNPDEAYLAGALCNVGKVVMALSYPEKADRIAGDLANIKILGTWAQAEARHDAPDHAILGEIACAFWGFPEYVLEGAVGHHDLGDHAHSHDEPDLTSIARLANQLCHWLLLRPSRIDQKVLTRARRDFGLSEFDVSRIADELLSLTRGSVA